MENFDFSNSSSITQTIENSPVPSSTAQLITEEKKLDETQMMEFSSSVADLMPTPSSQMMMGPPQDIYTNPTNGRVAGISLGGESQQPKRAQNPFNLTDEQFNALIAGVVAVIVFSTTVQTKLASLVPNFGGINGSIASALLAAIVYYFLHRFAKNR